MGRGAHQLEVGVGVVGGHFPCLGEGEGQNPEPVGEDGGHASQRREGEGHAHEMGEGEVPLQLVGAVGLPPEYRHVSQQSRR